MAERVALSRNITLDWLNAAAECSASGISREDARAKLDVEIAQKIESATNIRLTREILLHLWYDSEPWLLELAREVFPAAAPAERVGVHWALLMAQYFLFYDICTVMGTLFDYRDEISGAMIRERIYAKWGPRTTLEHALPKNLQTLRDLGAIIPGSERGWYRAGHFVLSDKRTAFMLLDALLSSAQREYISWERFILHPALFPFEFVNLSLADIMSCDRFSLERMGGELVIRKNDVGCEPDFNVDTMNCSKRL